jgi:hypothetical protein
MSPSVSAPFVRQFKDGLQVEDRIGVSRKQRDGDLRQTLT